MSASTQVLTFLIYLIRSVQPFFLVFIITQPRPKSLLSVTALENIANSIAKMHEKGVKRSQYFTIFQK